MALETQNKRRDILGVLPVADGGITTLDARHLSFYAGGGGAERQLATKRALVEVFDVLVRVDFKLTTDQGNAALNELDPAPGTIVFLNKPFKKLISVSGSGLLPPGDPSDDLILTVSFDPNVANPTQFQAQAVDPQGRRINAIITWIARGII